MKCQAVIRECVKFCEEAEGDKAIPSDHFDADGELPEQYIFCAKCLKGESGEVGFGDLNLLVPKSASNKCPATKLCSLFWAGIPPHFSSSVVS